MNIKWLMAMSVIVLAVIVVQSLPDEKVRMIFCDVGQGDGILISQGSSQLLVDVGPDNGKMKKCLEIYMPFWDRQIEGVVITHWDNDHSGSLVNLNNSYKINGLYSSIEPKGEVEQKMYTGNIRKNDVIKMGEIDFDVLGPSFDRAQDGNDNERSVVGILNYKSNKILLMGDVPDKVEEGMVWRGLLTESNSAATDVLKVSHHGSAEGTSETLLEKIKTKMAVISVGKNSFGHPAMEVIDRLKKYGVEIKRTDEIGNIVVEM